jgi:hypothetical protein
LRGATTGCALHSIAACRLRPATAFSTAYAGPSLNRSSSRSVAPAVFKHPCCATLSAQPPLPGD